MYANLVIKYIEYKSITCNFIKQIKSYITSIHSVKGYNNNNTTLLNIKYIIIYLLLKYKNIIEKLINYFDNKYELVEIKKTIDNKNITTILENTTISDTILMNTDSHNNISNYLPKVHTKFEICFPDKICLKKFLLEYRNYTLENIFKINNIKTNEDTVINIQYFEKGLKKEKILKYIDIKEIKLGLI